MKKFYYLFALFPQLCKCGALLLPHPVYWRDRVEKSLYRSKFMKYRPISFMDLPRGMRFEFSWLAVSGWCKNGDEMLKYIAKRDPEVEWRRVRVFRRWVGLYCWFRLQCFLQVSEMLIVVDCSSCEVMDIQVSSNHNERRDQPRDMIWSAFMSWDIYLRRLSWEM